MHASFLRRRILTALATSTLLACGGQTTSTGTSASSSGGTSSGSSGSSGGGSTSSTSSGSTGTTTSSSGSTSSTSGAPTVATCDNEQRRKRQCFAPESIITKNSGYGGFKDPDAAPPPPPKREANGCVVLDEVMNGCCNAAISGPVVENSTCCYEFCEGACCGRPLVVDGNGRVAPLVLRSDWDMGGPGQSVQNATSSLNAAMRAALHEDWARDALMEHASIASFAVFTLELLAVGAPPDLVADAQAAASDEIEHARLTFAIANRYADVPIGPGPLDLSGIKPSGDLATIAAACVRDGCINETIASSIAMAQSKNAIDPETSATLERIADDEARHAELAWRFVQWALRTGGDDVHKAIMAAFDSVPLRPSPSPSAAVGAEVWRSHGRLDPSEHAEIVRSINDNVIAPCVAALLGATTTVPVKDDAHALS